MRESNIEIRDTWKGWTGYNNDDYFANGNLYGGIKHFDIILKENGRADVAGRIYTIPNFNSCAYNEYKIRIPKRLAGLKHPIVHEITHFLQHNTSEKDKEYIDYNENNYEEYVNQRSELEAHFVQILFISKYELENLNIDNNIRSELKQKIMDCKKNHNKRLDLILYSKSKGII
jgi:iron uptake system EfeUOB component EfeO/EfeM